MVSGIGNFLTSSALSSISQSTTGSVSLETGMKALGRPAFILVDNKIDQQTKRYAAMKEFLYQATCLATYMAIVIPIFKNGSFKLAKNKIFKDDKAFSHFDSASQYLKYNKLAKMSQKNRTATLDKEHYQNIFSKELQNELKNKEKPEQFHIVKGAIEFGNIVGSVLGLAIFAPQVSHLIVHPALKFFGFEKEKPEQGTSKPVDVKA